MSVVNIQQLSGDSTFALANSSQPGRALVVCATQERSTANLGGFSFNGVPGTVYGIRTSASGAKRTLVCVWGDADLPATPGTYAITRDTSIAGGTQYAIGEFSGVDVSLIQTLSGSPASGAEPLGLTFSNSVSAFVIGSLIADLDSGTTLNGGAGQTDYLANLEEIITGKQGIGANTELIINDFNASGSFAYTAVAIPDSGPPVPALTAPESISPGETITFSAPNFGGAISGVTASDGTSTLTLTNITNTSGDNYTAVVPALPAVGQSLQYTTFGAVTMSATDGTSTAEDTTTLAAAAGQTVTILAETFDTSELSYLFNFSGTPATGDQFIEGSPQLALDANGGYVADTDGTYVITGIDATDGIAQSYNLILGDAPVDPPVGIGRITRRNLTRRAITRRSLTARP